MKALQGEDEFFPPSSVGLTERRRAKETILSALFFYLRKGETE